jgi:hypothetical protein
MNNIEIVEVQSMGQVTEHVIIDRGNGEYTSMLKSIWDELEAAKADGKTL